MNQQPTKLVSLKEKFEGLLKPHFEKINTTTKASIKDFVINRVEIAAPKNDKETKEQIEFYTRLLEYYKQQIKAVEGVLKELGV